MRKVALCQCALSALRTTSEWSGKGMSEKESERGAKELHVRPGHVWGGRKKWAADGERWAPTVVVVLLLRAR